MVVKRIESAAQFLEAAGSFLLADEARNNLPFALAHILRDKPGVYDVHHLWMVEDQRGRVVGAALRTPPYNLVLAGPASEAALGALAASLHAAGYELPGVTGAVPEVEQLVDAWTSRTDAVAKRTMVQRIYRVSELRPVRGVPGRPRHATETDRPLLVEWVRAFAAEAMPEDAPGRDAERTVDARLTLGAGGFTIWEVDGRPVSVAGWGARTPNGVRIGPVYTPPEHRGRGYGSAVTAAVSAEQLASGRRFCFLYTDLANPTSNRIYTGLGYEPVCDAIDFRFESPVAIGTT